MEKEAITFKQTWFLLPELHCLVAANAEGSSLLFLRSNPVDLQSSAMVVRGQR